MGKTLPVLFTLLLLQHAAQSRIIKPATEAEFQAALDSATPGDTIQLLPRVYMGEFIITKDSSPNVPITITGDYNSTIVSEGTSGITVKGNNWVLKSFKITGPSIGVLLEGSGNTLESIVLQAIGQGIVVRGADNKIKSCVISEAGGGVVLESGDRTTMQYNSINIQTPAIVVTEQTCCGLLDGNVANGIFEVKGNGYTLQNNVANHGLHISGCDNSLGGNVANGASFPKQCDIKDLGGNVYRGTGPNDTDEPSKYNNVNSDAYNNGNNGGAYNIGNSGSGTGNNGGGSGAYNPGQSSGPQGSYVTNAGGQGKPPCRCTCEWDV